MRRGLSRVFACSGVAFVAVACGGCGGTNGPSPTSPAPAPTPPPTVSACGVIGGSAVSIAILHGTTCSAVNSSVVLVNSRDKDNQPTGACSGTVITSRAVLTAAHCLAGDTAAVRIWGGIGNEVSAESFRAHPLFREHDPSSLDVGVVVATEDLKRVPIRLLVSRDARIGEQAVVAGWGKDENGNGTILRAGTTTISATSATSLETQNTSISSATCSGDSGGPLLLSEGGVWAIAGVTSATSIGGSCAIGTSFFANVRHPEIMSFIFGLVPNAGRQ